MRWRWWAPHRPPPWPPPLMRRRRPPPATHTACKAAQATGAGLIRAGREWHNTGAAEKLSRSQMLWTIMSCQGQVHEYLSPGTKYPGNPVQSEPKYQKQRTTCRDRRVPSCPLRCSCVSTLQLTQPTCNENYFGAETNLLLAVWPYIPSRQQKLACGRCSMAGWGALTKPAAVRASVRTPWLIQNMMRTRSASVDRPTACASCAAGHSPRA